MADEKAPVPVPPAGPALGVLYPPNTFSGDKLARAQKANRYFGPLLGVEQVYASLCSDLVYATGVPGHRGAELLDPATGRDRCDWYVAGYDRGTASFKPTATKARSWTDLPTKVKLGYPRPAEPSDAL